MQQWVQTVSALIAQYPEAQVKQSQLSGCNRFYVDDEEVRVNAVTSQLPHVPTVVSFAKESANSGRLVEGLDGVKFAFIVRSETDVSPYSYPGVYIQTLRVTKADGQTATFERVGKEEWFLPNSRPRN